MIDSTFIMFWLVTAYVKMTREFENWHNDKSEQDTICSLSPYLGVTRITRYRLATFTL